MTASLSGGGGVVGVIVGVLVAVGVGVSVMVALGVTVAVTDGLGVGVTLGVDVIVGATGGCVGVAVSVGSCATVGRPLTVSVVGFPEHAASISKMSRGMNGRLFIMPLIIYSLIKIPILLLA
jgi:hypothetical protein